MLQVMTLGLAGSLLGVALARLAIAGHSAGAASTTLDVVAAGRGAVRRHAGARRAQGIGIGVLVSLLFSVVPLLQVRLVKPSLLLRDETTSPAAATGRGIAAIVLVSAGAGGADRLAGGVAQRRPDRLRRLLRCWRSCCSWPAGCWCARSRRWRNARSFPLRHAVLHLSRPGNQTRVILLAVGLGAFFIVGVRSLQASLLEEFSLQVGRGLARHVPDGHPARSGRRRCARSSTIRRNGAGAFRLIPVLRARVTGVSGRETQLESFEDVRARGSLAREYTITYRDHLEANERIVDGAVLERAVAGARSVGRAGHPRALPDQRRRHGAVRHPRPHHQRAGHQHPRGGLAATRATAASCSCSGRASLDQAPQTFIAPLKGPTAPRRGRGSSTTWSQQFPERVGDRLPRDPRRRSAT